MLRRVVVALLTAVGGIAYAADSPPLKNVDLNHARAMSQILSSNPAHYKQIQNIVSGLATHREFEVPRWLRASFNAKNVSYSYFMLTTSPGQRNLSFVLGDTLYYGNVISTQGGGSAFLIRNR